MPRTTATNRTALNTPPGYRLKSFAYVGNGVVDRAINVGFQPDLVIIKSTTTDVGVFRTSAMSDDDTARVQAVGANIAGAIKSFTSTGFTIGTNAVVNTAGVTYHVAAFKKSQDPTALDFEIFQYTGNGTSQTIALGFQPQYVHIKRNNAASAGRLKTTTMGATTSTPWPAGGAGETDAITGFVSTGFTVGSNIGANNSGDVYNGWAFRAITDNNFKVGSYTGNATDDRDITGVGFNPSFIMVRNIGDIGSFSAIARLKSFTGDSSTGMSNTAITATNRIQALITDGFQLGSDSQTNNNGQGYTYVALMDKIPRSQNVATRTSI